tara:strand:- start:76 stop:333 length:258 start_codon:yes stop_codon:yes gene_type:complete
MNHKFDLRSLNNSLNKLHHDFLLERTRLSWSLEEGERSFIGEGTLEYRDEGTVVIPGGGSKGVSFGECWVGYQYIQYIYVTVSLA